MQLVPSAPVPISVGSEPLATPSKRVQMESTEVAWVLVMVAVSPQLELMPARISPLEAVIPSMITWRSYEVAQLPQARYSLPKVSTVKSETERVPAPLC